jgi:hypothetical protein
MLGFQFHEAHRACIRAACRRSVRAEKTATAPLYSNTMRGHLWRLLPAALLACGAIFWRWPAGCEHGYSEFHGRPQHSLAAGPPNRRRLLTAPEWARSCHVVEGPPVCPERRRPAANIRIADLTNPILKPWVIQRMKKANEDVSPARCPISPASIVGRRACQASRCLRACSPFILFRPQQRSSSSMS